MSVPDHLVGAWRRSGLLIDGRRVVDYCDVVWLQTPEWYADMRTVIDPYAPAPTDGAHGAFASAFAFGGDAHFDGTTMTWNHRLDRHRQPVVDANPVTWEDGVVVERGTVEVDGRPVTFAEEWLRMTGDDPAWSEDHDRHHLRVEVADFAVELTDTRPGGALVATRWRRCGPGWAEVATLSMP
jgi:hypothetical protein